MWKETVGQLDPQGYHVGTIYYLVDTQVYTGVFTHKNDRAVRGERYVMRYNVNNPTEIDIDYWHPVFEKQEATFFSTATIARVKGNTGILHPNPVVRYWVQLDGKKRLRWVYLPPDYKQLYPNLKEGQKYQVEHWVKNPNRVVLHLDKLIN